MSVLRNIGPQTRELHVSLDLDPDVLSRTGHSRWVAAHIEALGLDTQNILISTLRLRGVPPTNKFALTGDHNHNGVPDLTVRFNADALIPVLTPGQNDLILTGWLATGEHLRGSAVIQVTDTHVPPLSSSVSPNPLNPSGILRFSTATSGRVKIMVFNVNGRLVRVLMDETRLEAGPHEIRVDGKDASGRAMATGVYLYRIDTEQSTARGRFVVLK